MPKIKLVERTTKWGRAPLIHDHINQYNKFQHLIYLGKLPTSSIFKETIPYTRTIHPLSRNIDEPFRTQLLDHAGDTFYVGRPTQENVEFTIQSFDKRQPTSYHDNFHDYAMRFLECYSGIFDDCILSSEELMAEIDLTKASGHPGPYFGLFTKHDLINDDLFQEYFDCQIYLNDTELCIWTVYPKKEMKTLEDLKNNKIRLFTIPPYCLLYEQVRFGKKSSLGLKGFGWSAYGFNPYGGGVNKMAERLLQFDILFDLDVSGWDKFLPLMEQIYKEFIMKHTLPQCTDNNRRNFVWMCENTYNFIFKTPMGHAFLKKFGNPSGSGTTTRDNILAHVVIVASMLAECYFRKFGCMPTFALLRSQFIQLFGDDNIGGVTNEFDYILTPNFVEKHYEKYGMKLKFKHIVTNKDLTQLTFLGFKFTMKNSIWMPAYDYVRLATSFIYESPDKDNREGFLSRAFTLTFMSYPTPYFSIFFNAYKSICKNIRSTNTQLTPAEDTFLSFSTLRDDDFYSMFTGTESSQRKVSFFLLSDGWKEVLKNF